MKKLSEILPKITGAHDLSAEAAASRVLTAAEDYLTRVFGPENIGAGKKLVAKKLQNGLLFFEVSSSAWNNRLFLEKTGLLEELQQKFPQLTIRDVRGRVG